MSKQTNVAREILAAMDARTQAQAMAWTMRQDHREAIAHDIAALTALLDAIELREELTEPEQKAA